MEFWAVEVKAGEHFTVELHEKRALHLSQACIGEVEKGSSDSIYLFVNVNGKNLVLARLNTEKLPQQTFDLVFDKTFELFHNWKNGSVFFHGYTADNDVSDDMIEDNSDSKSSEESSSSESDEDIPAMAPNGGPASAAKQGDSKVSAGKDSAAGKQKVKVEPQKDVSSEDSDGSSDDDATSSEDDPKVSAGKDAAAGKQKAKIVEPKNDSSDDDDADSSDNDDTDSSDNDSEDNKDNKSASDEDSDSDEDEVTPVQVKSSKKRALVSASNKNVPEKKAKLVTPAKTDGKKSIVHVATPYPGKTPANKPNQPTPMCEGSHPCKSCKRTFKSEIGLESHTKAKHSGGK